ncbi:IclR family transcriptional regulator C-terminal domain-containing protein [Streptomyces sp. NPDC006872]|uniref:IclR family transcriptional regulator domain-containing protein n=1 Tax=Streptomyces sp. NPDC006872 TaxID=3155720 RepID=UPI0034093C57
MTRTAASATTTTTDFGALRHQIESVRTDGFSLDLGEILEEVCCLTAPVPAAARRLTADAIVSDATVDGIEPR